MEISEIFKQKKTGLSFEVFPPKKESGIETIYKTLDALTELNPDFISVTYGAGGSQVTNASTIDLCSYIKNKLNIETIAHLSCLYNSKEDVSKFMQELKDVNVKNILALRGDENPDYELKNDFKHASDLAKYIKSVDSDFFVSGACYPEVHQEAENIVEDIKNLKIKVDNGADHLISQLFFDNNAFFDFMEKVRIAGIDVPVEAGIMPVTNKRQIERMVSMCGASIPAKLSKVLQKFGDNDEAMLEAGISYATDQIIELAANGVDGVHIYTMNNPYVAKKITDNIKSIINV